jgi:serralysin
MSLITEILGGEFAAATADDTLYSPTKHFTTAQAGIHLNRSGGTWNNGALDTATTLTFAFRNSNPAGGEHVDGFSKFSATQINLATLALQSWADVSNLHFNRVGSGTGAQAYSDNATILFGNFQDPGGAGAAYAYLPFNHRQASSAEGDVWVNTAYSYEKNPKMWDYGMQTLTHEIGHALGFDHPGDYNAGQGSPTYADADYIEDTRQYTVMSYWSETNTGGNFRGFYSPAPLLTDIYAAQRLYGANLDFQTGDTVYGFNSNAERVWYKAPTDTGLQGDHAVIFCAWDAGGEDTFDFSGYTQAQVIDLNNEHFSSVGGMKFNVSISKAVIVDGEIVNLIENAIGGSAKDTIIGNNGDNTLDGRAGNDVIKGLGGNDNLIGGDGIDNLVAAQGNDTLTGGLGADKLNGAKGNDTFVFTALADSVVGAEDTILHGVTRLDTIDLSAIDAQTGAGNQAFHLVAGDSFTNHKGELIRFYDSAHNTTYIQGDVDGDGDADISIKVIGDVHTFSHFVL